MEKKIDVLREKHTEVSKIARFKKEGKKESKKNITAVSS